MLVREQMHDYQHTAVEHMHTHNDSMIWMGMGLGKTITTLTAIVDKINSGQVKKVLIFGPVRVINSVWEAEARKWEHTKHLTFSVIHGTAVKRSRAMFAEADIHLCNYENMNWLCEQLLHFYVDQGQPLPYQMCVYDEVSRVKNSTSMRVAGGHRDKEDANGHPYKVKLHGWRKMINMFQYRAGLTGTPASNGYLDLFGQFLVVDGGKRLGEYVTHYKNAYFESDYMGWGSAVTPSGKEHIEKHISDIVLKMDTKDYLDMPEVTVINRMVDLPKKARKAYDQMEANMFAALETGAELEVFSKSAVSNKCLQMCNGSPYLSPESSEFESLHKAKLDALEEVLEDAAGQPVLCSYTFKADAERIMKKFKKYRPVNLTEEKASMTGDIIKRWNEGKIKLLIGHPASMGHGVDGLQKSGSIMVWFGLPWSLELHDQMNARLNRQGQEHPVSIIRILCNDSVDLAVADAISRKTDDEKGLKDALQRYRTGITTNELEVNFL